MITLMTFLATLSHLTNISASLQLPFLLCALGITINNKDFILRENLASMNFFFAEDPLLEIITIIGQSLDTRTLAITLLEENFRSSTISSLKSITPFFIRQVIYRETASVEAPISQLATLVFSLPTAASMSLLQLLRKMKSYQLFNMRDYAWGVAHW